MGFLLAVGIMSVPAVLLWAASSSIFRGSRAARLLLASGATAMVTVGLGPLSLIAVPVTLFVTIPIIFALDWAYTR